MATTEEQLDILTETVTDLVEVVTVTKELLDSAAPAAQEAVDAAANVAAGLATYEADAFPKANQVAAETGTGQGLMTAERSGQAITYANLGKRKQLLNFVPENIRNDIMSGNPVLDHTAALRAFIEDEDVGPLWFPQGGIICSDIVPLLGNRTYALEECTLKRRTPGLFSFFYSEFAGAVGYGEHDNITIEGGIIDQNDMETHFSIFRAIYLRNARIKNLTVKHRNIRKVDLTANSTTNTFTSTGAPIPFEDGDYVAFFSDGTRPTGIGGNSYRAFNVNAGAGTMQLSINGTSAVDFTTDGVGNHWISDYGAWAMQLGGRDVICDNLAVLNGTMVYQDGIHIAHGDNIGVSNSISYAGDDCFVTGGEVTDAGILEKTIANVGFSNIRGVSTMGNLFRAYSTDATYFVKHIDVHGLVGTGGKFRNSGIDIHDFTNPDARNAQSRVEDIEITGLHMTVGDAARVQDVNSYAVWVSSAKTVKINGVIDNAPYNGIYPGRIFRSDDVKIDIRGLTANLDRRLQIDSSNVELINIGISGGAESHITVTGASRLTLRSSDFKNLAAGKQAIEMLDTTSVLIHERVLIPCALFELNNGTPARGPVGGGRGNAFLMDAVAFERISTELVWPSGWKSASVYLYWINAGAGTGDVLWSPSYRIISLAGSLNAADTPISSVLATAAAQDILTKTLLGTITPVAADGLFMRLNLARTANDVTDTLANDAGVLLVELVRLT